MINTHFQKKNTKRTGNLFGKFLLFSTQYFLVVYFLRFLGNILCPDFFVVVLGFFVVVVVVYSCIVFMCVVMLSGKNNDEFSS